MGVRQNLQAINDLIDAIKNPPNPPEIVSLKPGDITTFLRPAEALGKRGVFFNDYDEPTYLGFHVAFEWHGHGGNELASNFNHLPEGLLTGGPYSAVNYLRNIDEDSRADMIYSFRQILHGIERYTPHYIQSIKGLDTLYKFSVEDPYRAKDAKISLSLLEGIDLRSTALLDLYRRGAYDTTWMRWMLPDIMRTFSMTVTLTEYRSFHQPQRLGLARNTPGSPLSTEEEGAPILGGKSYMAKAQYESGVGKNIGGGRLGGLLGALQAAAEKVKKVKQKLEALKGGKPNFPPADQPEGEPKTHFLNSLDANMGIIKFHLKECEFDLTAFTAPWGDELSNAAAPSSPTPEIPIKVGHISEITEYSLLDAAIWSIVGNMFGSELEISTIASGIIDDHHIDSNRTAEGGASGDEYNTQRGESSNENIKKAYDRLFIQRHLQDDPEAEGALKGLGEKLLDNALDRAAGFVKDKVATAVKGKLLGNVYEGSVLKTLKSLSADPLAVGAAVVDVLSSSNPDTAGEIIGQIYDQLPEPSNNLDKNDPGSAGLTGADANPSSGGNIGLTGPASSQVTPGNAGLTGADALDLNPSNAGLTGNNSSIDGSTGNIELSGDDSSIDGSAGQIQLSGSDSNIDGSAGKIQLSGDNVSIEGNPGTADLSGNDDSIDGNPGNIDLSGSDPVNLTGGNVGLTGAEATELDTGNAGLSGANSSIEGSPGTIELSGAETSGSNLGSIKLDGSDSSIDDGGGENIELSGAETSLDAAPTNANLTGPEVKADKPGSIELTSNETIDPTLGNISLTGTEQSPTIPGNIELTGTPVDSQKPGNISLTGNDKESEIADKNIGLSGNDLRDQVLGNINLRGEQTKKSSPGKLNLSGQNPKEAELSNAGLKGSKSKEAAESNVGLTGPEIKSATPGSAGLRGNSIKETKPGKAGLRGTNTSIDGNPGNIGIPDADATTSGSLGNIGLVGEDVTNASPGNIGLDGITSNIDGDTENIGLTGPTASDNELGNIGLTGGDKSAPTPENIGLTGQDTSDDSPGNIGLEGDDSSTSDGGDIQTSNDDQGDPNPNE